MANLKTSQLAYADTLDGNELVAIVQNGQSVQTTSYAIGNINNNQPTVHIGRDSEASGDYAIAIGYRAIATGPGGNTALGGRAAAYGGGNTSVGYQAVAVPYLATAIGLDAAATGFATLACGNNTSANNTYAIAIGGFAEAGGYGAQGGIAIGAYSQSFGEHSIALGFNARISEGANYSVAIGHVENLCPANHRSWLP